uniref:Uncharacterized protein n=1 Tax=Oncorhynchus mykiss TaxID=8022 RepID=A0A8K9XY69_ONCMY
MMRIPLFPPWLLRRMPQRTFLLSCSLVVFPLYRSSSETLKKTMSIIGDSSKVIETTDRQCSQNIIIFLIITQ